MEIDYVFKEIMRFSGKKFFKYDFQFFKYDSKLQVAIVDVCFVLIFNDAIYLLHDVACAVMEIFSQGSLHRRGKDIYANYVCPSGIWLFES